MIPRYPRFPFGGEQRFLYPESDPEIQVDINQRKYWAPNKADQGYLPLIGYDRRLNPECLISQEVSALGVSIWKGPAYRQYLFEWRLQNLPPEIYFALWGMYFRQQSEKEAVLLLDRGLAVSEPTPRTRAKVGNLTGATAVPGMTFYWGIFRLFLQFDEAEYLAIPQNGTFDLSFKAQEQLPAPTTEQDMGWP